MRLVKAYFQELRYKVAKTLLFWATCKIPAIKFRSGFLDLLLFIFPFCTIQTVFFLQLGLLVFSW